MPSTENIKPRQFLINITVQAFDDPSLCKIVERIKSKLNLPIQRCY